MQPLIPAEPVILEEIEVIANQPSMPKRKRGIPFGRRGRPIDGKNARSREAGNPPLRHQKSRPLLFMELVALEKQEAFVWLVVEGWF